MKLFSRIKVILIAFLLLATFGQAVASSVMPIAMDIQFQSQGMDHAMHQMNADMDMEMSAGDEVCCDQDDRCMGGNCFSLAPTIETVDQPIDTSLLKLNYASIMAPGQISSSLYRPPIS